jgi:MoaA/NifB/PqqE/SkfB family radical SAM enzyme
MLSLDNIIGLNIEVSSICNAKCPFCSRNKKVRSYGNHLIRLVDFKRLPKSMFGHLEWIAFGGNFGDLAANKDMPKIAQYAKQQNQRIQLHGDSNGSLRKPSWWHELGLHYQDGFMVFSMDGLDDTHAIHRRGTDFKTIVKNVRAFASAGGVVHWKFILFEHNEHQIHQAERIAEDIGCTRFFVVSSREYNGEYRRPLTMQFDLKNEIYTRYQKEILSEDEFANCKHPIPSQYAGAQLHPGAE